MGVGKYSPTVSKSYMLDQKWWERNGGGFDNGKNPNSDDDDDGFDRYGYSETGSGPDRAGHTENEYMSDWDYDDDTGIMTHELYEQISREWNSKRLGDLNDYVEATEIAKETGVSAQNMLPIFMINEARIVDRHNLLGSYYMVHKDDIEKTAKTFKKKG